MPDGLICEYCGTTLRSLASPAEELEALEVLARSALRIEVASGGEGTPRARAVLGEAQAARERLVTARRRAVIHYVAPLGGLLALLAIMAGVVSLL